MTIIKQVELTDYKNLVYVYLTIDGIIPTVEYGKTFNTGEYILDFIDHSESGTLIRMIECDISKRFRHNEVTKPGMLSDYLNTELFNVGLPVKIIENRMNYINNKNVQNIFSFWFTFIISPIFIFNSNRCILVICTNRISIINY